MKEAIFANGCFWCTEAVFQLVDGVAKVESGYIGGTIENPTYNQVCSGTSGHAEGIKIVYDDSKLSYGELLEIFWNTHDPTTLNRQGNDVGTQYRSAIFYANEEEKNIAKSYMQALEKKNVFDNPIVTTLEPQTTWYPAEQYHQNYYNDNKAASYCQFVVRPKVEKFKKLFPGRVVAGG